MRKSNNEARKVGRIRRLSLENKEVLFTPKEVTIDIE